MVKKRNHSANAGRHSNADRGPDCYQTPPEAVHALLGVEKLPHNIWEPACGGGAIVGVLRAAGHQVHASDLHDYGCPDSSSGVNFLTTRKVPRGAEAVVTNPPYLLAAEFVERALELVPYVLMLLRLPFLESERRRQILDGGQLSRVHVFRNRLPMMHRADWSGPKASSSICFAWYAWNRFHYGPTTIDRISWSPISSQANE